MEDTNKELERLERELLAEEEKDPLEDTVLMELLKETPAPAFDDPDKICDPEEPLVYRNFSNDYGKEVPAEEPEESADDRAAARKKKDDKVLIGLMAAASVLCLGILSVLIYWMVVFLR